MKPTVIFIMGMNRSGSTLLDLMLGSHPNAFSLGELKVINHLIKENIKVCRLASSHFWEEKFTTEDLKLFALALSNERLHKYIPRKIENFFRRLSSNDILFNPYTILFAKTGKNILIDSSKSYLWISTRLEAREFKEGLVDAYLLYLIRDGRAVVNSQYRYRKKDSLEKLSHQWVRILKKQNAFYEKFLNERKMMVQYEKLATNPQAVLEEICKLLSLDFKEEMIEYWKHTHHHVQGSPNTINLIKKYCNQKHQKDIEHIRVEHPQDLDFSIKLDLRWKKELSQDQLEIFNRIAGDWNQLYEWNE